jgi:hypothetical protein
MSYSESQRRFLVENNLHIGSVVRILRGAEEYEANLDNYGHPSMDACVGKVGKITTIFWTWGIAVNVDGRQWRFPYFVP